MEYVILASIKIYENINCNGTKVNKNISKDRNAANDF